MVVNAKGDVFVKDDHCVSVFSADGDFLRSFGRGVLKKPYGTLIINTVHISNTIHCTCTVQSCIVCMGRSRVEQLQELGADRC